MAFVDSAVVLARLRSADDDTRRWLIAGAVVAALLVPLVVTSPGNDLDVANVFRSGRAIARNLTYVPSRPPGAPAPCHCRRRRHARRTGCRACG